MLNFAGAFVSIAVAATIAKGIVDPEAITLDIVLAGLVGAITWNLITWFVGLPSSSSHALIGGMIGSAMAAGGKDVVQWHGILDKVLIPSLIAPFLGIAFAFSLIVGDHVAHRAARAGEGEPRLPARSSSSRAASSRSRTGRTTRRRRWGSSRWRSSPPGT